MNDDELRDILARVAAGELDADEAARLLDPDATIDPDDDDDEDDGIDDPDETEERGDAERRPPSGETARELRVSASMCKVRVVGDPSVRELLVRGAAIRRENGLLVVDAEPWFGDDERTATFVMAGGPPWWGSERGWDRGWERRREHRRPGPPRGPRGPRGGRRDFDFNRPIDIRANPDLDLSLEVSAGSAKVTRMRGKIVGSVNAGSASFDDVRGPFDLTASAGSLTVQGPIAHGASRINCDLGSVKVRLEPGSDVRISIDATMSKPDVRLAGWGDRREDGEWIVGDGTASLAIVAAMSSIRVREYEHERP
jgi:hypothetical protein